MFDQTQQAVLMALHGRNGKGVCYSLTALQMTTGLQTTDLRAALRELCESGAVQQDGSRYKVKEVTYVHDQA